MQTVLGPFEPYLENAIVDEIRTHKQAHPFAPLLVLVPSTALRQHLKAVLSRQHRLSLLNVHLLTFYQLALRLRAESHGEAAELRDELFFEEVLRQLVRARQPGAEAFAGVEERVGGSAALWQTLRDLRDGMVDPELALEATLTGQFAHEESHRTKHLLRLLQTLLDFCRHQGISESADLFKLATQQVPASSLLKTFEEIFYYGFYDLTQIQLDFFHAVAQRYPITLFFPLLTARPRHEAWSFAERFYERYVQGYNSAPPRTLTDESRSPLPATFKLFDETGERRYTSPPQTFHCTIINAFGIHDEVAAAAKEILRLVEDENIAFHEIGVVARTLDAYGATIKEIFRDHQIPLSGDIEEPLVQFPLTKAVILLVNLPTKDFLRSQVIDLLSSPYFQIAGLTHPYSPPRPDLWDLATRELAICKGIAQWRRLRIYGERDLFIHQLNHDEGSRIIKIEAAQLHSLADIVDKLSVDLLNLPQHASWSAYATSWRTLLAEYFGLPDGNEPAHPDQEMVAEKILALLDQIAALDKANGRVSSNEFSQTFQHWLERSTITASTAGVAGVRVLNATAARGLSFKALFILGVNEGVFPRTIREDAFLRDCDREILERDLGYKVNPKLAAFDEEKLIFTLLVTAARERLCCSYQRCDETGRVLAPSWYLGELKRALSSELDARLTEMTIPRSPRDKARAWPFNTAALLLPEELAIRLSLENRDPGDLVTNFATAPELYKRGRMVVAELDRPAEKLSGFDGAVGPLPAYWEDFSQRVSPTALESYARCPFQFFARQVLGLERLDRPEEIAGPGPVDYGELGHAILKGVYRALIETNYFNGESAAVELGAILAEVAERAFGEYEKKNPVGYPLTWDFLKEEIIQLLHQVITRDLEKMAESGFAPVALEAEATAGFPVDWPAPLDRLVIRGRMDRIDHHSKENRLRVIDYKFKFGAEPTAQERDLARAALRGQYLQPPLYSILGERWANTHAFDTGGVDTGFYYIARRWRDGPLVTAEFNCETLASKLGGELKKTITDLLESIHQGRFYMQPGTHCARCDVAEICRKNHPPSLWRAENDPVTRMHRDIQAKDPSDP